MALATETPAPVRELNPDVPPALADLVTQEQYERVMGRNPSHFAPTGGGKDQVIGIDTRQLPVECVTWEEAVEFCRRLSEWPEEAAKGHTYRLPTEAEWEYLCRGGPLIPRPSLPFSFGRSLSTLQANFDGSLPYGNAARGPYLERTTVVGSYPPNALGLYDIHGNVWQWCADWYGENYYQRSPRQDPPGPAGGERRVLRGGCWGHGGRNCRAARRNSYAPGEHIVQFGFRVVMTTGPGS